MKRPMLVSGVTMIVIAAFLMISSKVGAVVMLLTGALAFVLYLIKPLKLRRYIIIPVISTATLLICTSFLAYTHFKIEPAIKYDGTTSYISGKVISIPVNANGYLKFVLKTDKIGTASETLKIDVTIPESENVTPALYDYISIDYGELSVKRDTNNKYDLSTASDGIILNVRGSDTNILWQCKKTPYYYCLNFRELVSNRISEFMLNDTAGMLKGLIFGGSNNVPDEVAEAFRNSGISHLLAVSGLHTSLWCGLIIFLFRLFKAPKKIRNIFCVIFLICFCAVTGFTPSVLRSSLMSLLLLTSPFTKSRPDSLNSLGFASSILLLSNPYIIFSLSFQLSLFATLGVLMVSHYETTIYNFFSKIKAKPLISLLHYFISSLLLSISAGLFTMPVSALRFNVFSIVSPITNLLCVKPAFYAMICGTIATATSYIEFSFIKKFTLFLFDVTDFLLSYVSTVSLKVSEFTYCTVPVHRYWLLNGLICSAVILTFGYLIFKIKDKPILFKISTILMIVVLFINIFIPLLPTPYRDTLTIVSSGNNINIVIRSGTHYAFLTNTTAKNPSTVYNYLPKATCESLDYYFATCADTDNLKRLCEAVTPVETHITPELKKLCSNKKTELPPNTIIKTTGKYNLCDKINFEIIDTYSLKYVIIRGNKKTAYVHLDGTTDFSEVVDTTTGNIFIYNGEIPHKIPVNAESIIICGDSEFIIDENYNNLKSQFRDLHLTAREGDIQINF